MEAALNLRTQTRGDRLLLQHCRAVSRVEGDRAPARTRLEQAVGSELARLLLFALAPHGRRGSSSP